MSFSAFTTLLPPTGVDHCTTGFLTHCPGDRKALSEDAALHPSNHPHEIGTWAAASGLDREGNLLPNLVVVKANILEVYVIRTSQGLKPGLEGDEERATPAAWLELAFESRLNGNVASLAVIKSRQDDFTGRRTQHDALVLALQDAKLSVVDWDEDKQKLRTSSLHCFESARWQHLKRGLEKFPRGPLVRADPQGRCAAALLYDDQLLVMKAKASGLGFGDEETAAAPERAASVEETYFLDLRTVGVKNVKDIVFLHGYLEPALLVLHEPDPTWGGRAAVGRFTCEATVLSVNTTLRQHPQIFAATSLPYDAYQAVAVPSPLGGALVLAANTVHYFSQTSFHTLAVNNLAGVPEGAPVPPRTSFEVELDVARVAWVAADTALISSKTGALLLLTLGHVGRTVDSLELSRSKGAVLASAVCPVGDSLVFLGSRLGDSMLLQYARGTATEATTQRTEVEEEVGSGEPPAKRARYTDVTAAVADDNEELSLYGGGGAEQEDPSSWKSLSFAICDTMVNIGPVRDLVIGRRTKVDPDDETAPAITETELVLCSGHAKNGALSILHQGIRAAVTSEVDLGSPCRGIWAVHSEAADGQDEGEAFHDYLFISLEDGTRVLSTGEDIAEVDDEGAGFFTSGPSLAVGNLFGRARILQVHAGGFVLLQGSTLQQEVPLFEFPTAPLKGQPPAEEVQIAAAAICDPFVLFRMTDGTLRIGEGDVSEKEVFVGTVSLAGEAADGVTAVTLFEDHCGYFGRPKTGGASGGKNSDVCAAVARSSGAVEIYKLPGFELLYRIMDFIQGRRVVTDRSDTLGPVDNGLPDVHVSSLVVRCSNSSAERGPSQPFLCAVLSSGALFAYRGFLSGQHAHQGKCGSPLSGASLVQSDEIVKGSKPSTESHVNASTPPQSKRRLRWVRVALAGVNAMEDGSTDGAKLIPSLTTFEGVNEERGVYICAQRPAWIVECQGRLRPHPQLSDGPVAAFSPFHNVHNPHGFVYSTPTGVLRIAQIPTESVYDAGWPVIKVPLKATPHSVAHFPEPDVYAVTVSVPVELPFSRPPGTPPEEAAAEDPDGAGARGRQGEAGPVYCDLEQFELRVLAPGSWEMLQRLPLLRYEHVAAASAVTLKNITNDQRDTLLAVGTTYVLGEDAPGQGRVLLYRVDKQEDGAWLTAVYKEEHRAGITAVSAVQGCLLAAVGSKLILYRWDGQSLVTAAFFDAPMYVTSITALKSYVLVGDFQRSLHFLAWVDTPAMAQLRELAKDYAPAAVAATAALTDGKAVALLAADFEKTIRVYEYSPPSLQLVCKAEFYTGAGIAKCLRVEMTQNARGPKRLRSACLFGTLDGALATLAPLDEMTFKRLQALSRRLSETLDHVAGLHPRAFRKVTDRCSTRVPPPETVADLDALFEFEMLSQVEQATLARQIGTTQERILADMNDLRLGLTVIT
ncbi:Cleavage/polyadenylation specificity factor [Klebsormidium nitens]|uniref:Cleavage/polyadenylation specificity factor n=1 Tax=Klebsormidium nitens TaxID=105231 RepID=A0A1Y1IMG6_KLENI|nr:Cleavage/polyadenylation specificity factor [Klebsormidium nitens]|eukprot:GAQ89308.1 Cleavage/polyadenylation specificity factor [Klebsormidium nitens]